MLGSYSRQSRRQASKPKPLFEFLTIVRGSSRQRLTSATCIWAFTLWISIHDAWLAKAPSNSALPMLVVCWSRAQFRMASPCSNCEENQVVNM